MADWQILAGLVVVQVVVIVVGLFLLTWGIRQQNARNNAEIVAGLKEIRTVQEEKYLSGLRLARQKAVEAVQIGQDEVGKILSNTLTAAIKKPVSVDQVIRVGDTYPLLTVR